MWADWKKRIDQNWDIIYGIEIVMSYSVVTYTYHLQHLRASHQSGVYQWKVFVYLMCVCILKKEKVLLKINT